MGSTITGLQEAVTNNAGVLGNYYHEGDLTDELVEFLGHDPVWSMVASWMQSSGSPSPMSLGIFVGVCNKYQVAGPTELKVADVPDEVGGRTSSSSKTGMAEVLEKSGGAGKLWVSASRRTGFRRLHITGNCWYRAGVTEDVQDVSKAVFNAKCDVCWKRAPPEDKSLAEKLKGDDDTSVETDDESSSSVGQ